MSRLQLKRCWVTPVDYQIVRLEKLIQWAFRRDVPSADPLLTCYGTTYATQSPSS